MNKGSGYMENPLRHGRGSSAQPVLWAVRIGVPLSAILISSGFFFSMLPPTANQPSGAVALIYAGAVILAFTVVTLGIGLIRDPQPS